MFDINQFRDDILTPTLGGLQINEPGYKELLVFTCAVETYGGTYIKQINGPALGIYQIEPTTFSELWHNYVIRQPQIVNLMSLNLNINRLPSPNDIMTNLTLATALCVLYYKWRKAPIPETTPESLWAVYKEFYNTYEGKAEEVSAIKAYKKFIRA